MTRNFAAEFDSESVVVGAAAVGSEEGFSAADFDFELIVAVEQYSEIEQDSAFADVVCELGL